MALLVFCVSQMLAAFNANQKSETFISSHRWRSGFDLKAFDMKGREANLKGLFSQFSEETKQSEDFCSSAYQSSQSPRVIQELKIVESLTIFQYNSALLGVSQTISKSKEAFKFVQVHSTIFRILIKRCYLLLYLERFIINI